MAQHRFFCAAESRANGETIYGTVARIRTWLLLEHSPPWRPNAVEDSKCISPELKDQIRRLAVDRTLLIRQQHHHSAPLQCFLVRSCDDPPSATRHTIRSYANLESLHSDGKPSNELLFAVCTHGRHDRCCAKFGFAVWSAFHKLAQARAWQCSHVGGDRFAANVVLFPYGIYYGRVLPEHVPELLRASDSGEVWLPGYRGRCCFPRPVQIAEYFLRKESHRLRLDEFRPLDVERIAPETTRVRFQDRTDGTLHTVEFVTRKDALHQRLTCDARETSAVPQYSLASYTAAV